MICAKVKRSLPLLAGGDLSARKARIVLAHIDGCPICKRELEEYQRTLGRVKSAARGEPSGDWTGAEWQALMARIAASKTARKSPAFGLRPRWALASGLAAVIVLAVTVLFFKDVEFRPKDTLQRPGPDVVSVTMVSQETGLQVVWFFNKDFDWKGDQK